MSYPAKLTQSIDMFEPGATCIYREKGQPGLRPGYGKSLEKRLGILENDMARINESLQEVLNHVRPTFEANTAFQTPGQDSASAPQQTSDPRQLWPQLQHMEDRNPFTSTPMANQVPHALDTPSFIAYGGLPEEDALHDLVELFFQHIYPWAPLFCKSNFTVNMFLPEHQILMHGIVVTSFRFWTKPQPPEQEREAYIKTSRERVLLESIDICSLVATQALALLAIDALGQGPGPRTWNVMSLLVKAAQQMRLTHGHSPTSPDSNTPLVRNEEPVNELDLSVIEMEEKHRLFWVIYSLDRFSTVSHGQNGGIDTNAIRLPYPSNDEDWGQNMSQEWFQRAPVAHGTRDRLATNMWHHNIDALALLDKSNQLLLQPVNLSLPAHCLEWQSLFRQTDANISAWFENLPPTIREQPALFSPMWAMLHATFYLIKLRFYTVAAFPSTTSPYLKPSSSARSRCRQAVSDIVSLTKSLQPHNLDQLGPMFSFVVWVAARSLIILWTSGYENGYGSTPVDLDSLLKVLQQMAARWPCAQRYSEMVQLILETRNSPGGPMGLEIFNDTRHTTYGLQRLLGGLTGNRAIDLFADSFDFLDIPVLDIGDLGAARVDGFSADFDAEWL